VNVRDVVLDSSLVGAVYRTGMQARAAWFERRGHAWRGLSARLRALRSEPGATHAAAAMERVRRWHDARCRDAAGALLPSARNGWLAAFLATEEARRLRAHFAATPMHHRVRLREPNDEDRRRQGNLIILKRHDPSTGEKGVLLLTYSETLRRFPAMYDLPEVAKRYAILLEPSSWGYEDPTYFLYAGSDVDVVVQAPWARDYQVVQELRSNVHPVRIGAGDWVDPAVFAPGPPRGTRRFDVVVVSSWSPWKRHADLFEAAAALRQRGVTLRLALVGYPLVWDQARIERMAERHGVRDWCTFFDSVPQAEVARIVGESEAYLLLSRREGANRALYEALFCDTPVVVYAGHRGVDTEMVSRGVGALYASTATLGDAIVQVLAGRDAYQPLAWARAHSGFGNATTALNAIVREMSLRRGLPWTQDMVAKKNAPEVRYVSDADQERMEPEYERLGAFLR
jgi:glycosyltransferase involved in cell wall biosynthesis